MVQIEMRIGLQITDFSRLGTPADYRIALAEIARTADKCGFYSLWMPDHLLNAMNVFGQSIEEPVLEPYSTIAFLAALTGQIKLGLLVTCNLFRHPALLVKTVSTLDVLSSGRAYLGIGAGWFERETKSLGIPFPSLHERFNRLEETLQIARKIWNGDTTPYTGRYYQLEEPINSPQPLTIPHPPILIGGGGEKKTLRLVAKYGDACNFFIGSPLKELPSSFRKLFEKRSDTLRKKLAVLKQHCIDCGRSYDDIEKTVQTYVKVAPEAQNPTDVISLCYELADLGFEHTILNIPNVHEIEPLKIIGEEVIPQVRETTRSTERS